MEHFQNQLREKHLKIVDYFKNNTFGTNMPILTHFSRLSPLDRCIILERLLQETGGNIYIYDKLVLAYCKIGQAALAQRVIELARKRGESAWNINSLQSKLDIGVPQQISNQERLGLLYQDIQNVSNNEEINFLRQLIDFVGFDINNENSAKALDYQDIMKIHLTIQKCNNLFDLKLKYTEEFNHPYYYHAFAIAFLQKNARKEGKEALIKGALFGIQYPCAFYNDIMIDSIGQCIATLINRFQANEDERKVNAFILAYIYLSQCIKLMPTMASDSYRTRAILCRNELFCTILNSVFRYGVSNVPPVISDYYLASKSGDPSPHPEAIQEAIEIQQMNAFFGGRNATEYTLDEISEFGQELHDTLFMTLENAYKNGDFDISKHELQNMFF